MQIKADVYSALVCIDLRFFFIPNKQQKTNDQISDCRTGKYWPRVS